MAKIMKTVVKKGLCPHHVGLSLGIFAALIHAVWAILVAVTVAQPVWDWIMPLHFVDMAMKVFPFSILTAVMLVVMAFIGGYVMGWLFAVIYNRVQ